MRLVLLFAALASYAAAQQSKAQPALMPWPAQIETAEGTLPINSQFTVVLTGHRDPLVTAAAPRMVDRMARQTGIAIPYAVTTPDLAKLVVDCKAAGTDESYSLAVTPERATLTAAAPPGILHGMETFLQLVAPSGEGFGVPAVRIQDQPRFPWRGLMIDISRHFMPMDVMKRTLDGMAAVKLNVLHWHVSDDQGFRIESRRFPNLHRMGSDGLFYTQDQVREVVAYARERAIRVVPEFDMPGHTTAWFVGHPELATAPGPYEIARKWGIFDAAMDPSNEKVYQFLDVLIGEMAALFPDEYFHIGGDEVNGKAWDASPRVAAFKQKQGIKDNHALQGYFNRRLMAILTKHGKKMIGWDEILQPDLPKSAVIHSWRGQKSLAAAARQGYRGILSNGYYLDYQWSAARHYAVDPLAGAAAGLTPAEQSLILGGEACMWAEFVTPETIDSRVWPRMAAIAERLWSPAPVKDVESMYTRMEAAGKHLEWAGLTHRSNYHLMLQRLTGNRPEQALRILADVVEPVKEYNRPQSREYRQQTPLNRLVDAARPESETARQFSRSVDAFLAGDKSQATAIRRQLAVWRDNNANLKPLLTDLLAEAAPLSEDLSALASAALDALDGRGDAASAKALIARAKRPRAEVLLMVVPAIERLTAK